MSVSGITSEEERFDSLVAGFVLGDLSFEELVAIDALDPNQFASAVERTENAASRIYLTLDSDRKPPIPPSLKERILSQSPLENQKTRSSENNVALLPSAPREAVGLRELASWFLAIAASALVFATWLPSWSNNRSGGTMVRTVTDRRDKLIANAPDAIRVSWQKPTDSKSDSTMGDIVWSSTSQEGYMRFTGLPKNDPKLEQYQLWIFDPERDEKPIDGGVFNIDKEGEVLIPIVAKLPVGKPTLFAITVEKPGGVVVSDRSRLPLLAKVE